ncbi:membrane protein [Kosmotoga arenicorallina S304]|uniref:Membrane protein n=1 Tax=Kosmotoga arenicorallina S304 TaxID=1453497 RepID=A0A176K1H7_9BACT|nr:lactate utilization protein [Kosmotoga arenicorallina]OAA30998.1 membrane protein [Kosmotoga arenicorallina S304]
MREELYKWKYRKLAEVVLENFAKHGIDGHYVESRNEVVPLLEELLPAGSSIAVGGSLTLTETGVLDFLRKGNYNFIDRYTTKDAEERKRVLLESFGADYFLCSANAITVRGEIVQMDGHGTRVAPMIYGPEKVIIIAGINKVVSDLEAARERIKYISPMNARRLNLHTPCTATGICMDCRSNQRICETYVILNDSSAHRDRYLVILVGEDLGL